MKWRAFSRMPQWVRLSEWLGISALATCEFGPAKFLCFGRWNSSEVLDVLARVNPVQIWVDESDELPFFLLLGSSDDEDRFLVVPNDSVTTSKPPVLKRREGLVLDRAEVVYQLAKVPLKNFSHVLCFPLGEEPLLQRAVLLGAPRSQEPSAGIFRCIVHGGTRNLMPNV